MYLELAKLLDNKSCGDYVEIESHDSCLPEAKFLYEAEGWSRQLYFDYISAH